MSLVIVNKRVMMSVIGAMSLIFRPDGFINSVKTPKGATYIGNKEFYKKGRGTTRKKAKNKRGGGKFATSKRYKNKFKG